MKLIDEGCTIPFISRYRKEATGSLNDEQLRALHERLLYLRNLEEKKEQVLGSIEEQGKLTPELKAQILEARTLVVVEDLYRPYRPKRRTRATVAKEKGLEPLANILMLQTTKKSPLEEAEAFLSEEKGVETAEDALAGAKDILAEYISDEADYRIHIRKLTVNKGTLVSTAKKPEESSVYEMYYEFEEPVRKVAGHRVLALNRGEKEKILTVKINVPEEEILGWLCRQVIKKDNPNTTPVLKEVVEDSYKRLIAPAIEREIRNDLTEKAEDGAIRVFGKNLEQLLMQPPIAGRVVLGWDPAFRTGCKLAVVDATGKVLDTTVIYPTAPTTEAKIRAAKDTLNPLLGQPPSKEYVEQIREIVMSHPEILGIHDLVVHDYGPGRRMVSLHGEVSGNGDIYELHDVIDRIEKELNQKMGCEAVIHMDPIQADDLTVSETKKELVKLLANAYPDVSIHDFRMVQGPTHTNLIFDAVVPYGYDKSDGEVKEGIERLVAEHWDNYFAVVQVEQSYI